MPSEWVGQQYSRQQLAGILTAFRRPKVRSMRQFAEEEIYIPTGQYEGAKLNCKRQPFFGHWFDLVDSGQFAEFVALGPSQSGKSLGCFTVPILYHLFECRETVVAAVPIMELIRDKWEDTLLPVIERTRYRELLPRKGSGSKGGTGFATRFEHGVTLRWMTAGGSDKSRSNFTTRVVCMTETDGFDETQETSDEGTKIAQIEARMKSYPAARRRFYKECTVSHEHKHTWHKYIEESTSSRIMLPCPHCKQYVLPEREHLLGWEQQPTAEDARENTAFHCPECKHAWTEGERRKANLNSIVAHKGQQVDPSGTITGDPPKTLTLGFRWTASHNSFVPAGDHGADEWNALRSKQPDLEERKQKQFSFALPIDDEMDYFELSAEQVNNKRGKSRPKSYVPEDCQTLGIGCDVGKRLLHWTATADLSNTDKHVCDYGRIEVPSDDMPLRRALIIAFRELADALEVLTMDYHEALVDVRWSPEDVFAAIHALDDDRWTGNLGFGDNHFTMQGKRYNHPKMVSKTKNIRFIGTRFFGHRREKGKRELVLNSDSAYWKAQVQHGFAREPGDEALTVYDSTDPHEHISYGKHIASERETITYEPGKGHIRKWETLSKANHWLDSTYMSLLAIQYRKEKPKPVNVVAKSMVPK